MTYLGQFSGQFSGMVFVIACMWDQFLGLSHFWGVNDE